MNETSLVIDKDAKDDLKCLIELASQNKVSWEVPFFYLENWTPQWLDLV